MINVGASAVLGLMDRINETGSEEKPATVGAHGEFAALLATTGGTAVTDPDAGTDAASAPSGTSRGSVEPADASVTPPVPKDGGAEGSDPTANSDLRTIATANDTSAPSRLAVPTPTETTANHSPAVGVPADATHHSEKHLLPMAARATEIAKDPTDPGPSASATNPSDPSPPSTPVPIMPQVLTPAVTADPMAKDTTNAAPRPGPGISPVTVLRSGPSQLSPNRALQPPGVGRTSVAATPTSAQLPLTARSAGGSDALATSTATGHAQRQDHTGVNPSTSGAPSEPATRPTAASPLPGSLLTVDGHGGSSARHSAPSTTTGESVGSVAPTTSGSPPAGSPVTVAPATSASIGHLSPTRSADASELPGVASQLTSVLAPLRPIPAGGHTLTIALQPEGLGTVRATMTSIDDQLVVRLATSSPEADVAVRNALPELHASLSGGHQDTTVTLSDSGSSPNPWANAQSNSQSADQHASPDRSAGRSDADTSLAGAAMTVGGAHDTTTTTTSSSGLDVRM